MVIEEHILWKWPLETRLDSGLARSHQLSFCSCIHSTTTPLLKRASVSLVTDHRPSLAQLLLVKIEHLQAIMSGIEVAGIALAVFTVAINGISHFVEGMETIKYWRRYRIKLQGYAASMKAQKVFYLDTLEALFADIVESDEDLVVMMAEPGGLAWQRADYDKRLRQRLHRSYDVYLDVIRSMLNDLDSLCGQLGLSSTGEVSRVFLPVSCFSLEEFSVSQTKQGCNMVLC